jgi:GMP synthase (glutamine-hydrolysing)
MNDPSIVVVELGCQYTRLIEQRLREIGFRSAVLPPKQAETYIRNKSPKAIILSGSRHSVNNGGPVIGSWIFQPSRRSVLGICYGMQLTAKLLGGQVVSQSKHGDYGPVNVELGSSQLFQGVPRKLEVWASHGDTVDQIPDGFVTIATSASGAVAAMENRQSRIYGLQFHPEVQQTPHGTLILSNFAGEVAECSKDWNPSNLIEEIRTGIADTVGKDRAIIAFSGGVDSTTLAAIAAKSLGSQLKAVCIDGGQLREGELDEIRSNAKAAGVSLEIISGRKTFDLLWTEHRNSEPDPETKRKLFRMKYQEVLAEYAREFGAAHFIQGTLAPDMIESGQTGGDVIKTHHNIGVKLGGCSSLHPFSRLFKYEVRALAESLGLPASVTKRQPFPGPGLFIRVKNGWPTTERLEILRWADKVVTDIVKAEGLDSDISQMPVILNCGLSVGVKGSERVYAYEVTIRPVRTVDFMTAEGIDFPKDIKLKIESALTKHPKIVGALWKVTPKPPGTVESE